MLSVIAAYSKNMQRTGHGEREAGVRWKGTFARYVDKVGSKARSEQSSQEVNAQADPSAMGSNPVRSQRRSGVNLTYLFML